MSVPNYISDVMFNMDHGSDNDPKMDENAEMLTKALEEAVNYFAVHGKVPSIAELLNDFYHRI